MYPVLWWSGSTYTLERSTVSDVIFIGWTQRYWCLLDMFQWWLCFWRKTPRFNASPAIRTSSCCQHSSNHCQSKQAIRRWHSATENKQACHRSLSRRTSVWVSEKAALLCMRRTRSFYREHTRGNHQKRETRFLFLTIWSFFWGK